jgi:hypothetical protein
VGVFTLEEAVLEIKTESATPVIFTVIDNVFEGKCPIH